MAFTVGDGLKALCEEMKVSFDEYVEMWLGQRVAQDVPSRYGRLVHDVALSLPQDWDEHAEWGVEVSWEKTPQGYASTFRDEESAEESEEIVKTYVITIYPALMDSLSDSACRWVLAHEFAHIGSKLRFGSVVIKGRPHARVQGNEYREAPSRKSHEASADNLALVWGFDRELQAFLIEDSAGVEEN